MSGYICTKCGHCETISFQDDLLYAPRQHGKSVLTGKIFEKYFEEARRKIMPYCNFPMEKSWDTSFTKKEAQMDKMENDPMRFLDPAWVKEQAAKTDSRAELGRLCREKWTIWRDNIMNLDFVKRIGIDAILRGSGNCALCIKFAGFGRPPCSVSCGLECGAIYDGFCTGIRNKNFGEAQKHAGEMVALLDAYIKENEDEFLTHDEAQKKAEEGFWVMGTHFILPETMENGKCVYFKAGHKETFSRQITTANRFRVVCKQEFKTEKVKFWEALRWMEEHAPASLKSPSCIEHYSCDNGRFFQKSGICKGFTSTEINQKWEIKTLLPPEVSK